jgi:hypothetical protein
VWLEFRTPQGIHVASKLDTLPNTAGVAAPKRAGSSAARRFVAHSNSHDCLADRSVHRRLRYRRLDAYDASGAVADCDIDSGSIRDCRADDFAAGQADDIAGEATGARRRSRLSPR